MALDASLLSTQHYKLTIKGKVEHPPQHHGVEAIYFNGISIRLRLSYA